MTRSLGRSLVCSWLAASIAVGGCRSPQPASVTPPTASTTTTSTTTATGAPADRAAAPLVATGRPEVALADRADGQLDLAVSAVGTPPANAQVETLDARATAALIARLEPLPRLATAQANAALVRPASTPPTTPVAMPSIVFPLAVGKPVVDAPLGPPTAAALTPMEAPTILPSGLIVAELEVRIRFAEPMVPVAAVGDAKATFAHISPQVAGTWRWLDTRVLGFFASTPRFPQATSFTVTVPAGVKALSGRSLDEDAKGRFETRSVSFAQRGATPSLLRPDTVIAVQLDQRVDAANIAPYLRVQTEAGKPIATRLVDAAAAELSWAKFPHGARAQRTTSGAGDDKPVTFDPATAHRVYLAPRTAWPANTNLRVMIAKGAPSAEGLLVTAKPQFEGGLTVVPPFTLLGVHCKDTTRLVGARCPAENIAALEFSNPVEQRTFRAGMIDVSGDPADEDHALHDTDVSIWMPAAVGARVTVKIAPGLLDTYGQAYGGASSVVVTTTSKEWESWVDAPSGVHVLDPRFEVPQAVIHAHAVASLSIELYKVTPADYFAYEDFEQGKRASPPGKRVLTEVHRVGPRAGADWRVDLRSALTNDIGHVVAIVRAAPLRTLTRNELAEFPRMTRAWIQVTKLGITARYDGDKLSAWVRDISPAHFLTATGGAKLSVLRDPDKGGVVAQSTADANGHASFALPSPITRSSRRVPARSIVIAENGADSTFTTFGRDRAQRHDRARWYVTDDRFMYKPGEKVYVKGWVRWTHDGTNPDLAPSKTGETVTWELFDARRNRLANGTSLLSEQGGFDVAAALPPTTNLGTATFYFRTRSSAETLPIAVQEFRTPAYRVSLEDDVQYSGARPLVAGEQLELRAEAGYYAGGGLPGAEIRWAASLQTTTYTPPGWDRYTFTAPLRRSERSYWTTQAPSGPQIDVSTASSLSGSSASIATIALPALANNLPSILSVDATVADMDRMQIRASSRPILVHPSRYYAGLRMLPGSRDDLEIVVTDIDGELVAGVTTTVEIEGVLGSERFRDDASVLETQRCELVSGTKPITCAWNRATWEHAYSATVTIADERGRKNAAQYTIPWWSRDDKVELAVAPDKPLYRPGETAKLDIVSATLPATAMVTVARNGIVTEAEIALTKPRTTYELPIDPAFVSDVHVQVDRWSVKTVRKGKLPFPEHTQAEVDLRVDTEGARLSLTTRTVKPLVEPGGMATFEVRAMKDGKPVANAEVALMAVDEAVLSLSGRSHADPLYAFYQDYPANTRLLTTLRMVRDQGDDLVGKLGFALYPLEDTMGYLGHGSGTGSGYGAGGGRGNLRGASTVVSARKDFRPVAVWSPLLHTDANGLVTLRVKMPDNLTRFRIVALAAAQTRYFGKAESAITTQRLVNARTIAPRFLTQGDRFSLPVLVQNLGDAPRTIDVAVRAANLRSIGPAGQRVRLGSGQRAELRFELATQARGTATIQTILQAGQATDASNVSLPVYEPATTEAFATYGIVDGPPQGEQLVVPKDLYPEVGGVELEIASTQLQTLTEAFWYLYAYPYECAEQRSARMLATSAMYDVLEAFAAPNRPTRAELATQRDLDAAKLAKDQRADGTWGYFGGMRGDPYVTQQVLAALGAQHVTGVMRDKARWAVTRSIDANLATLATLANQLTPDKAEVASRVSLIAAELTTLDAVGVDVRSRTDRVHRLATALAIYPIDAKARILALVAGVRGAKAMRAPLVTALLGATHETAATATVATTYTQSEQATLPSNAKTEALVLEALMRELPQHTLIPKLARGLLARQKGGRWRSTQENLVVLTALRHYFDRYEVVVPAYTGRLWLGKDRYSEHAFTGHTTEKGLMTASWKDLAPGTTHAVSLVKDGPGRMYYRVGVVYAPKQATLAALDAGFLVRRTYTALDNPRDVQHLPDGDWRIALGARVLVTLQTRITTDRHSVAFVDPLPAGFEAVNDALATAERPAHTAADSAWDFRNLRDNRAEVFASVLPAGTHQFSYTVRATTPGTFVAAPAKAEEMYAPETFGRSASGNVKIE